MFCSKTDMQRVEMVQYKALQVVYDNYMATYDDLLALDNKLKIHQRHFLVIGIYKSKNNVERNFKKYNIHLQKSNKKNPLFEAVKENVSKLPKGIKTRQKEKKVTKERKNVFPIGDSMIKDLAEKCISKDHNMIR